MSKARWRRRVGSHCGAFVALGVLALLAATATAASVAIHVLRVLDASGQPTPARVVLRGDAPAPRIDERLRTAPSGVSYFYTSGISRLSLSQPLEIRVSKGFGYRPQSLTLEPGISETVVRLERPFDVRARGYYSADGHVHPMYLGTRHESSNAEILEAMKGEDLNLVNALSANAFSRRVYWRHRVTGRDEPESEPDYVLRVSEEYRSQIYGHLSVFGVRGPSPWVFSSFADTLLPHDYPLNYLAAKRYRKQGAFASFGHLRNTSKIALEAPADIALGVIDAVEIMGYAVPTRNARRIWEQLLLTGFDVVLTAGTDTVLGADREGVMGGARMVARLGEAPFGYAAFVAAIAAGRGFVTSGPLVFLQVSGRQPGERIALAPNEVRLLDVEIEVLSVFPWSRLSVRHNGRDALTLASAPGAPARQMFAGKIEVAGSGWIYAAVDGPPPTWSLAAKDLGGPLAMTNPVWLDVPGAPRRHTESAESFVRWIERDLALLDERDNYGSPGNRERVRETLRRAIGVFRGRAESQAPEQVR